jgi:hypothetical protein
LEADVVLNVVTMPGLRLKVLFEPGPHRGDGGRREPPVWDPSRYLMTGIAGGISPTNPST